MSQAVRQSSSSSFTSFVKSAFTSGLSLGANVFSATKSALKAVPATAHVAQKNFRGLALFYLLSGARAVNGFLSNPAAAPVPFATQITAQVLLPASVVNCLEKTSTVFENSAEISAIEDPNCQAYHSRIFALNQVLVEYGTGIPASEYSLPHLPCLDIFQELQNRPSRKLDERGYPTKPSKFGALSTEEAQYFSKSELCAFVLNGLGL